MLCILEYACLLGHLEYELWLDVAGKNKELLLLTQVYLDITNYIAMITHVYPPLPHKRSFDAGRYTSVFFRLHGRASAEGGCTSRFSLG